MSCKHCTGLLTVRAPLKKRVLFDVARKRQVRKGVANLFLVSPHAALSARCEPKAFDDARRGPRHTEVLRLG